MIPLPSKIKIIKEEKNKVVFEIEGLYPGYGVTVGNSLRRVLLSSLEGTAITQVRIKGVSHEFSIIEGVIEDVIMILLNLKKLRFKVYTNEPQKAVLKTKGIGAVKGSDFDLPSQVEIINPETHIAALTTKSAQLEMEVLIEKGVGYEQVEDREVKKWDVGVLPLDAVFTPVKKVAFRVENMRVGKRTDFDRLIIEIETDGTMTPQSVISKASEILVEHFSLVLQTFLKPKEEKPKEKEISQKSEKKKEKKPKKKKKSAPPAGGRRRKK